MLPRETASLATPIGVIRISATDDRLLTIIIDNDGPIVTPGHPLLREATRQLAAYFAERLMTFDLPLEAPATPRGDALRQGISDIGYGETASYGDVAKRIGSSPRAIGQACARNSLPIIVPCHRVLGANHALGAYSAGKGPATKQWLLTHERGLPA